jgi:ribosomal protein L13E
LTQKETPVRADAGTRYDFWFADDGLYRVEILRRAAVELPFVLPVVVLFVLAGLQPPTFSDSVALVYAALIFGSVGAAILVPTLVANRRRRRLGMTFAQAKAGEKTTKIPWDDVKRISLMKRTTVRLELRKGRLSEIVRATIDQNDANRLKGIIVQSKVGRRFDFRDGIFK